MSDALSFAEAYRQHVELLPARIVLSMFIKADGSSSSGGSGSGSSGDVVAQLMGSVLGGVLPKK